ncbi:GNAT family N-acetyltransferase [Vibrio cyclitrophicus]|uniref:GNAT family N-acetyltransferase n=2 Tax=Vibrio cyclitrophicus TaxID=47951 RepID=A0A7Z1MH50_9VIBR|nr:MULTISPECIES: GNAT family N-acetyltransferase [Vibrio]KNH12785.1 acetyltransferase [Vibrio lentus]MBY7660218.1 GNAT family N-acetyltransferase [Vibrio atlanticus]KAA8597431.1 Histone acetyltransferase HPA2 [Vibrio cyclitrophicus]MBE8555020.1 GNAT family N-acetyltransferase [Vibrio sp. OPT24]MCC4775420.1 GNAT family N-acetyltransferase [Vibrio cyclitrophicus]|tara:strand:- start:3024 stop:3488 length:465 start_codon:yes stop_codon:yes gene_type:complete
MIKLRPMTSSEYPAYCDYFIDDYSREIVENYGHSLDRAIELANQDLLRSFPNGLETNDHALLCVESGSELVGYLWHSINAADKSTFIYDFFIFPNFRNNGYGKLAISVLESQLKSVGIEQIKLRVAYQNQRALKLYQEIGFAISGYNMSKKIVT